MSQKIKLTIVCLILCFIGSLNYISGISSAKLSIEDSPIVLFDEFHGQIFNHSLYSKALADLEREGMKVRFNREEINKTTLNGVDIFVSTNPNKSFSYNEVIYLSNHLERGKAVFLLSNALDEENETLNGRSSYFNNLLSDIAPEIGETGALIKFWTRSEDIGSFKRTDVVRNDFSNVGEPDYIRIEVNSSDHEILAYDQNLTTIFTSTCSVTSVPETGHVITASPGAYAVTVLDEIHTFSSDITVLGSAGPMDNDAEILLSGSSIMFSDLNDTAFNTSWYEMEDNSKLWINIFKFLDKSEAEDLNPTVISENALLSLVIIGVVAVALVFSGSILFSIGSGKKIQIVKSEEILKAIPKRKEPIKVEKEEPDVSIPLAKQTKRDRRLQQIKKHSRRRKK